MEGKKIATEKEAFDIGNAGGGYSDTKLVTKAMAEYFGCSVSGNYSDNQLVAITDLSRSAIGLESIEIEGSISYGYRTNTAGRSLTISATYSDGTVTEHLYDGVTFTLSGDASNYFTIRDEHEQHYLLKTTAGVFRTAYLNASYTVDGVTKTATERISYSGDDRTEVTVTGDLYLRCHGGPQTSGWSGDWSDCDGIPYDSTTAFVNLDNPDNSKKWENTLEISPSTYNIKNIIRLKYRLTSGQDAEELVKLENTWISFNTYGANRKIYSAELSLSNNDNYVLSSSSSITIHDDSY